MKDDFYIGWASGTNSSRMVSKKFFGGMIVLMLLIVAVYAILEKPFPDSRFEYGNLTELNGQLVKYPVVSIRVPTDIGYELIPLVGNGKMGPNVILADLLESKSYDVKLNGTFIEYKGRRFFELTEGMQSILSSTVQEKEVNEITSTGTLELRGEIVDPKCFFGVMKPGYGKVHKSCAIRCLSGDIPPVFAVKNGDDYTDFYLIEKGNGLNIAEILNKVGTPITIKGEGFRSDNWNSIRIMESSFALTTSILLDSRMTKCES